MGILGIYMGARESSATLTLCLIDNQSYLQGKPQVQSASAGEGLHISTRRLNVNSIVEHMLATTPVLVRGPLGQLATRPRRASIL